MYLPQIKDYDITCPNCGSAENLSIAGTTTYPRNPLEWYCRCKSCKISFIPRKKEENSMEGHMNEVSTEEAQGVEIVKTRYEIAKELLPKEEMIRLKDEGKKDKEIYQSLGIHMDIFYRLKREYGLMDPVHALEPAPITQTEGEQPEPTEPAAKLLTIEEALKLRDKLRQRLALIDGQLATIRIQVV